MNCPKCNTENRLGAIFCRTCGEKLDIHNISAENFEEKTGVKTKKGPNLKKIIPTAILLILILGLGAIAFLGTRIPTFDKVATSSAALASVNKKMDLIPQQAVWFKQRDYKYSWEITEQELNSYLSDKVKEIKKGPATFDELSIELLAGNKFSAWFKGKIFGLGIVGNTTGSISVSGGTLAVALETVKLGKLPIPAFLHEKVIAGFMTQDAGEKAFLSKFDSIEIVADKMLMKVSGSKEYTPPKKRRRR